MSCSVLSCTRSLVKTFDGKIQEYISDIENVHMVWLEEIQQEANRMFSSDFSAEPELMPKTPIQKKNSRRKRISAGQEENRKRRSSKGKRNLRISSVNKLNLIAENEVGPEAVASELFPEESKRNTRHKTAERGAEEKSITEKHENYSHTQTETAVVCASSHPSPSSTPQSPPQTRMQEVTVKLSAADRLSAEILLKAESSPGRSVVKIAIATTEPSSSRRSSVRHSLSLRRSLAGLRHSMTQASVRRASRRSFMKKKARAGSSSRNVSEDVLMLSSGEDVVVKTEGVWSDVDIQTGNTETSPEEKKPEVPHSRLTRSTAQIPPTTVSSAAISKSGTPEESDDHREKPQSQSSLRSRSNSKRRAADAAEDFQSPRKKPSPKRSQTAIRPNMRSFLQTVQKNQLLMMTPSSMSRSSMMKSFIKNTTPHKVDLALSRGLVKKEQLKLDALKKKQEQEEDRRRKMEDDKKKRLEELKKKRDERLRKVVEARVKDEEEKLKMRREKNDKAQLREERLAEEKARKMATKRQEELEQRRKLEDETRRKKIQQAEEEEKCLQEMQAKRRAEEEQERARKLAEARRAIELKKEQEREREREAAERDRVEQEKALALKREVEKAAREKEKRELEEMRKELEEKRKREAQAEEERAAKLREAAKEKEAAAKIALSGQVQHAVMKTPLRKGPGLNVTVDIEGSPQSYDITPKGGNKPVAGNSNSDDYGMDQKSDDSTDDESAPRKPIPSWAEGINLKQSTMKQYFNPLDLHTYFGEVELLKLENIFYKSKPRYFKRTSSAVWNSPPKRGNLPF
ncbi:inner centromere protein A-like isoform X1 [Osmerus eperlanus]|uniref:inner centromere protein A-like isoform X1 n=1 Tax=Osmerus eperlanus TaxID=29151 RepID=UPI002E0F9206